MKSRRPAISALIAVSDTTISRGAWQARVRSAAHHLRGVGHERDVPPRQPPGGEAVRRVVGATEVDRSMVSRPHDDDEQRVEERDTQDQQHDERAHRSAWAHEVELHR